ncbi:MAG: preprotein translocase subunit SecY [Candidatus Micrarchaeaceae archaeon]
MTDLHQLDPILKYVPVIKRPSTPLSFREKMVWTGVIMGIFFLMFSTPALGVSKVSIQSALFQLINTVFASRMGYLTTVGIGPIVIASIVLQLVIGAGVINVDLNDTVVKGRFQSLQKLFAMGIAVVEAAVFVNAGYAPLISPSFYGIVVLQLALSAIIIVFLDEAMTKYGITSGINLFIAGGVAYAIVATTASSILPSAAAAIASGGAAAMSDALLAFAPLFAAVVVFLISIYVFNIKVELPMVFSQFRGIGGRLPIPLLYVSVLPVILTYSLTASLTVWFALLAHVTGPLAHWAQFFALYTVQPGSTSPTLTGGLLFLISPSFPTPFSSAGTSVQVVNYAVYLQQLVVSTSPLVLPSGATLEIPGYVHIIIFTVVFVLLSVLFGKFWIEMTGQSPKNVAQQLQDTGWQIPGFRRDPRIVENLLNKYIPVVTVLGSIIVALLAVFATLAGAVGTGVGILLTVGIMYMVYQQIEQENALEAYPQINKLLS